MPSAPVDAALAPSVSPSVSPAGERAWSEFVDLVLFGLLVLDFAAGWWVGRRW